MKHLATPTTKRLLTKIVVHTPSHGRGTTATTTAIQPETTMAPSTPLHGQELKGRSVKTTIAATTVVPRTLFRSRKTKKHLATTTMASSSPFRGQVTTKHPVTKAPTQRVTTSVSSTPPSSRTKNNAPTIRGWQFVLSGALHENAPVNTTVFQTQATDNDAGPNGMLTFSIAPYSGRHAPKMIPELRDLLKINPITGRVSSAKMLDFDTLVPRPRNKCVHGMYLITATDHGTPPKSGSAFLHLCFLDVNDNAPQFVKLQKSINVNETVAVGSEVFRVQATDVDKDVNGDVSYFLKDAKNSLAPLKTGAFAIDHNTGVVTLMRPLVANTKYVLRVVARDGGKPPVENVTEVRVFVRSAKTNPPTISKTTPTSVETATAQITTTTTPGAVTTALPTLALSTSPRSQLSTKSQATTMLTSTQPASAIAPSTPLHSQETTWNLATTNPPATTMVLSTSVRSQETTKNRTTQRSPTRLTTALPTLAYSTSPGSRRTQPTTTKHLAKTSTQAVTTKGSTTSGTHIPITSAGNRGTTEPVTITTGHPLTTNDHPLTTTVDQDEQEPTDSQITTETPVLHPRTTTVDVPVLTSSASHPDKDLTDKTDFWALVGCGAALALLAVINVHFFRKKCKRRQLR